MSEVGVRLGLPCLKHTTTVPWRDFTTADPWATTVSSRASATYHSPVNSHTFDRSHLGWPCCHKAIQISCNEVWVHFGVDLRGTWTFKMPRNGNIRIHPRWLPDHVTYSDHETYFRVTMGIPWKFEHSVHKHSINIAQFSSFYTLMAAILHDPLFTQPPNIAAMKFGHTFELISEAMCFWNSHK